MARRSPAFLQTASLRLGSSRGRNGSEQILLPGEPLARQTSRLRPRFATPEETALFERHRSALGREPDDLEFAYLVELDDDRSR